MKNSNPRCVSSLLLRSFTSVIVLVVLLVGCASQREMWRDVEVTSGTKHEAGSAIDSDYLVRRGSTLAADFASGCRIYVESGGRFEGLGRGGRECTIFAEQGADLQLRTHLRVIRIKDARRAFAERNKPVVQELGPGVNTAGGVVEYSRGGDDQDDDDDDHYHRRHSPEVHDVKISGSSYKKKDD